MIFFHLGDLHIGKTVGGFPMLEDQRHILAQVTGHVRARRPDAVILAGDIYDKATPSGEAVQLFSDFLTALADAGAAVLLISGNHDSAERLAFGDRLLKARGVHIASVFRGAPERVELSDAHGPCHVYLLPFIRPTTVRLVRPDADIHGYGDAMRVALDGAPLDPDTRNVLVAHQFIASSMESPERSDSEIEPVGGIDAIDAALFDAFDYVALGHLHGPQRVGRDTVRYAGSPLKYSFSECFHQKRVTQVTLGPKGQVDIDFLPLTPLHDMRKIAGPLDVLISPEVARSANAQDYLHVTLTDEEEVFDAIGKLRAVYPNVMELRFDSAHARGQLPEADEDTALAAQSPLALLEAFYAAQNGRPLSEAELALATELLGKMEDMP